MESGIGFLPLLLAGLQPWVCDYLGGWKATFKLLLVGFRLRGRGSCIQTLLYRSAAFWCGLLRHHWCFIVSRQSTSLGVGNVGLQCWRQTRSPSESMKARAKGLKPMENTENIHTSAHKHGLAWWQCHREHSRLFTPCHCECLLRAQHTLPPATPKGGFISILP